ncbi:MAG: sodium-dependent transporter [Deltaproteobacteria bacterium]|nr:sodium-dependent transporter [Deltaproteobacteria bacterium]
MPNTGLNTSGWVSLILGWGFILCLAFFCLFKLLTKKKPAGAAADHGHAKRDYWATRAGLILAMAGNAVGLGNFLRFPVKAAANGGGAFLVPYFIALLVLGIPLMWVEWSIGRYGGSRGHGTTPGMFSLLWKHPIAKYLGAFGIFLPFMIGTYYVFIEAWTLGYAWFSATGAYMGHESREAMRHFLLGFQGVESNNFFTSIGPVIVFVGITLALNYLFLVRGISKGIEVLARYGMPLLFVFAIVLVIRVLTLGAPDPALPDQSISAGLGFMWNADFSRLSQAGVWLVAAGQIFFTLSLGQGMINTYASYVKETEDVTLNGLATSSLNEFAEVILGGTIAIPVAVAFFGIIETQNIAAQGAFDLGFVSLPVIFQKIPFGQLFGTLWFLLLFIAAVTSSVAMTQPAVAFFVDEFKWSRFKAVNWTFGILLLCTALVVSFYKYGFLDELDFWIGTLGLALFAVIEVVVFSWIFGIDKGFAEMHKGADIKVPGVFKFVIKYITPLYLLVILGTWTYQEAGAKLLMHDLKPEDAGNKPYLWGARGLILAVVLLTLVLIYKAWQSKRHEAAKS